jgi:hypothetical protein
MSGTICPNCGQPTLSSQEYCKECGQRLMTGPPVLVTLYGCGCAPLLVMGGCALAYLEPDPQSGAPINVEWLLLGVVLAVAGLPVAIVLDRLLRPKKKD